VSVVGSAFAFHAKDNALTPSGISLNGSLPSHPSAPAANSAKSAWIASVFSCVTLGARAACAREGAMPCHMAARAHLPAAGAGDDRLSPRPAS